MFDNASQMLVNVGAIGYLAAVPILRFVAAFFMTLSTYKTLRIREEKNKLIWLFMTWVSPIGTRIVYEIYRRVVNPIKVKTPKTGIILLFLSIVSYLISAVLLVVSISSMGIGFIKSEIDDEPLITVYDMYGNEYHDKHDVPLYDKDGNTYLYEPEWFTEGKFVDQNGNVYDGDFSYLDENGYFYYDADDKLEVYNEDIEIYTDGEMLYYLCPSYCFFDKDGTILQSSGKMIITVFPDE